MVTLWIGLCLFLSLYNLCIAKPNSNDSIILPYIIGDVINGNLTWNISDFGNTSKIELILSYNNRGVTAVKISFGMINNTGYLAKDFRPNFSSNAQHLLITNNATGIFELKSSNKYISLQKYKYLLFQSIILNNNKGFSIAKNMSNTNKSPIIMVQGMIVQTVLNQTNFSFNIYLATITNTTTYDVSFNVSLNILSATTWPETCGYITNNVTYCPFTVNITNSFGVNTKPNITKGYSLLALSFSDTKTNYFAINGFPEINTLQKVFVYSKESAFINVDSVNNGVVTAKAYQDIDMSFNIDSLSGRIYAVLEDIKDTTNQYVVGCDAHSIQYYDAFGWRFKSISNNNTNIVNGKYLMNLYMDYGQIMPVDDRYVIYTHNGSITFNVSIYNDTTMRNKDIINVSNTDNTHLLLTKGETETFEFIASVNNGTMISVYFEQCKNATNGTLYECKDYYPNNDGRAYLFEYDVDDPLEMIPIPNDNSLQNDDGRNMNLTTNMIMNISLCDQVTMITTKQNVCITTSSSSTNNLGEDEYVGIASAAIIAFGFSVWFLCLRHKKKDDGYRAINT